MAQTNTFKKDLFKDSISQESLSLIEVEDIHREQQVKANPRLAPFAERFSLKYNQRVR